MCASPQHDKPCEIVPKPYTQPGIGGIISGKYENEKLPPSISHEEIMTAIIEGGKKNAAMLARFAF